MAKYVSSPRYSVSDMVFDANGVYETEDITEIKRLDALVPTWIRRIDEPEEPQKDEKATEEPQKPAPKAPRKAANASAK